MKSVLQIKDLTLGGQESISLNGEVYTVDQLGSAVLAYTKQLERNKMRKRKKASEKGEDNYAGG